MIKTKEEYEKLLANTRSGRTSKRIFPEFWLKRNYKKEAAESLAYKTYTGTISEEELRKTKICSSYIVDFWTIRGYTEDAARQKVSDQQRKNSLRVLEKYSPEERKKFSACSIEYYLNRGLSIDEAHQARSDRQRTFSLKKCIQQHGEKIGREIWEERQKKWQTALNSKPEEEIKRINSLKGSTLNNFMRLYGEEGEEKYKKWVTEYKKRLKRNGMPGFSQESLDWFNSFIPKDIMDEASVGENERFIFDGKKIFFYDFTYRDVIVEYHSSLYHFNPRLDSDREWSSPFGLTKEQSLKNDAYKKQLAESKGFKFFEFYSDDSEEFEQDIKSKILIQLEYAKNNHQIVEST